MTLSSKSTCLLLLCCFFLACKKEAQVAEASNATTTALEVDAVIVTRKPFSNQIKATANILPDEYTEIKTPLTAEVMGIFFQEGQYVAAGKPLVQLNDKIYQAQINGFKAELKAAQSTLERKQSLLEIEGSTKEEIETAMATVESLEAKIEELQEYVDLARIKAPFSGRLGMRNFSKGAYLTTGDIVTTLTATNRLKVDFMVPQSCMESLRIGNKVDVTVGGDTLKAEIYAINPQINSSTRSINVRAKMSQPKGQEIMPGAYAEVFMSTDYIDDAILIPTQAVVPEINKETVFVIKNGRAKRTEVITDSRTDDAVRILSGVEKGDTLIVSGLLLLKEDMLVRVNNINK